MAPPVPVEDVALAAAPPGDRAHIVGDLTGGEEPAAARQQLLDRAADMRAHVAVAVPGLRDRFMRVQPQRGVPEGDKRGRHQQQQAEGVVVVGLVVGGAHHQRREVATQTACRSDDSGDRTHALDRRAAGHPGEDAAGADPEEDRQQGEGDRRPQIGRRLQHRDRRHHRRPASDVSTTYLGGIRSDNAPPIGRAITAANANAAVRAPASTGENP